jgi:hypothetical protein
LPQEEWLTVFTTFANTTSVGTDQAKLLIFVGDNEIEEEEEEPEIFKIIKSNSPGNLNLTGSSFTVTLDLTTFGLNVVKEINDIMVNYMGEANERTSQYDEDEDFAEMISADDIDENGNIISSKRAALEEEEESDE